MYPFCLKTLKDIKYCEVVIMKVGSFLSFADFFFDGFVADYLVQSKISDVKEQVQIQFLGSNRF